ncbi:hypothetical protein U9M48_032737 [Paspalum notatum var. saurae]|uniref:Uncharacterized protein n=1 Tax=Paspalum notatum var. saurae TaxID=547442 RepID=A0AAQ3U6N8_PASNO
MASLSSPVISRACLAPHNSAAFHRRGGNPSAAGISESSLPHRRRTPDGLALSSWGMNNAFFPIKGTSTRRVPAAVGPALADLVPSAGDFISNLPFPQWVTWLLGAFVLAVPTYRSFRQIQERAEATAEAAIEVIDHVAEAVEKVAEDVAEAFPENERIKDATTKIKKIADHVEEDVDKAEAFLDKVDEIEAQIDALVDNVEKRKPQRSS